MVIGLWALSWLGLYLEVVRYRHVTLRQLGDVLWPSAGGAQPGGFVRSVVVCSLLLPICAALLWLGPKQSQVSKPQVAPIIVGVGALLIVLGAMNQVVRRPPLGFDLTLRTGNGGFIVIGLVLGAAVLVSTARRGQHNVASRKR